VLEVLDVLAADELVESESSAQASPVTSKAMVMAPRAKGTRYFIATLLFGRFEQCLRGCISAASAAYQGSLNF
jgi:hypothetical protein